MENYLGFLWVIISYILGSFPSGFIISKFSVRKNILGVGWKKTSGSNVFRNIGAWQGVLTGILDVGKGFLVVWLAKNFNFSTQIQILSGVAAVIGHNWSCFLKLAGGRGIGTFVGAFWALSPKILGYAIVFPVFLALIWNAAIGTILLLIISFSLSLYFNQFQIAGVFVSLSLIPIFLKRLSPIGDIVGSDKEEIKKKYIIKNRLIFDDNIPHTDFRIIRFFKRLTKK